MSNQDLQNNIILRGYDPVTHQPVPVSVTAVSVDAANGEIYATLQTSATGGGGGGADTQYQDGTVPPTNPTGNAIAFNNNGVWRTISAANPLPVNATVTPAANQRVNAQVGDFVDGALITEGAKTDTPATDNTSSWSMISLLKAMVGKLLSSIAVTQSGTWTVQPGNTANTTAWKVDGSGATQPVSGTFWQATQPVSGTVTASPGAGTFNNQQSNVQTDYDTSAGVQNMTMFGLALPASGGAVPGGTATNPIRTDPTGTTNQPISGTVTGTQGAPNVLANGWPVKITDGTNIQPTGDAAARTIHTTVDNASIPVTGTFWQATQPVSGTMTGNQGSPNVLANRWPVQVTDGTNTMPTGDAAARTIHTTVDNASLPVTQSTTPWVVQDNSQAIPYHNLTAASTNFTNVKGAACTLYSLDLSNTSAATIFVKLYDKATAPATTDTPKRTIQIPANATVIRTYAKGIQFTTGFGWAATGAVANNDATAIAANCVVDFDLNI